MNKKFILSLMTSLMVAMMSVAFTSCSSDDSDGGSGDNALVGTWRKIYSDGNEHSLTGSGVNWVFFKDGSMEENDIDDDGNIEENKTEYFKYKTENGHLYTMKQKEGKTYNWKDEGAYTITGVILELTKDSGKVKRYQKIK